MITEEYREFKLENGLVVALRNTPTQTIMGKLRVNFGFVHQKPGEEGLSHLLEHCLVTGGSSKYDVREADSMRRKLAKMGASTNVGRTTFFGGTLCEDFENWLAYVSDHTLNPRFDQERLNGERGRVLREISDSKSDPSYAIKSAFIPVFYRGHPKGILGIGKEEVVENSDSHQLSELHDRGFHPNNMDLIIAGGLPNNIENLVRKYFGEALPGENTRVDFPELAPLEKRTILTFPAPELYNVDRPEESSAGLSLSCVVPSETHPDAFAVTMMSHILGGSSNSLLFNSLSLEKGLAYQVSTQCTRDYNGGEFHVHASLPARRLDEAVGAIFDEMEKMKHEKIDDDNLMLVRKRAQYGIARTFESNEGHIELIDDKLDYGLTAEIAMERYNKVTAERILEVANKYLPDRENGNYILTIKDPLKK
ncbi:insulinase family protein [Candidatus Pacearchaeota archaeon]|nr:insulinase family protein [Candidatus Pacearchaeota archaeon]